MRKSNFIVLICDLDNTVYDWYAAFLPAFYDMVNVAAPKLKVDEAALLDQLRAIHVKHRDVEHPFALMETEAAQKLVEEIGLDATTAALDPAFHAFNKSRKVNLQTYPGVKDALTEISSRGVRIIAYTDSKYYAAAFRIDRLQLSPYFHAIYCREKSDIIINSRQARENRNLMLEKIFEVNSHKMKPNPQVLQDIISSQKVNAQAVAYIGDSLAKDILMAKRAGCFSIWAKYGAHTDAEMYERLVRVSHWTLEDIEREREYAREARYVAPDFICERSFGEVLNVI